MQATLIAGRRVAVPCVSRSRRTFVIRAQLPKEESAPTSSPAPAEAPKAAAPAPLLSAAGEFEAPAGQLNVLSTTQEAINGRAAMLGFVAAVVSEALTHQAVWSQIAGRYADGDLLEAPIGSATLLFGAVVALTTMATLVPKLVGNLEVDSRSFGPFTPGLEKIVGRVAQMGFAGLLIVELVKGSALLG
ncbi:hypothetical protein GPECTOR_1g212 [Gonium pectorale]|uniref:Uncharacterized protein n=1 Tax=Gonium pectorale TaxID=33097 RepID=A0A150H2I8_GONPE|nr:hypothetical protein GPECTOR_1g212 [Gonium pectorale]|eukprot:KXZ56244.1 hypothetical protein GPECTOR_1g212 [Gonium pectorale]